MLTSDAAFCEVPGHLAHFKPEQQALFPTHFAPDLYLPSFYIGSGVKEHMKMLARQGRTWFCL